jgi:tRNA modification GTPase
MAHDLASSFSLGNAVKNGIPVVIAGSPNTGKSTLLNYLLNEEKAIVSEIPGTTRDAIEDVVIIDGIQFRFVDTEGIRVTDEIIENLGINRTREKIGNAFLVLPVIDINEGSSKANDILESIRLQPENINKKLIILANKTDIATKENIEDIRENINTFPGDSLIFISAKTGEGLDKLKTVIIES